MFIVDLINLSSVFPTSNKLMIFAVTPIRSLLIVKFGPKNTVVLGFALASIFPSIAASRLSVVVAVPKISIAFFPVGTDILPLVCSEKILNQFLLMILSYYHFFWYAVGRSAGTKMPRTNWSDMKKFLIFLPPISEQQKIVSILSEINKRTKQLEHDKSHLESLKKGLMQKLLTGQIRVKTN